MGIVMYGFSILVLVWMKCKFILLLAAICSQSYGLKVETDGQPIFIVQP